MLLVSCVSLKIWFISIYYSQLGRGIPFASLHSFLSAISALDMKHQTQEVSCQHIDTLSYWKSLNVSKKNHIYTYAWYTCGRHMSVPQETFVYVVHGNDPFYLGLWPEGRSHNRISRLCWLRRRERTWISSRKMSRNDKAFLQVNLSSQHAAWTCFTNG